MASVTEVQNRPIQFSNVRMVETMEVTINGVPAVINKDDFNPKLHKVKSAEVEADEASDGEGAGEGEGEGEEEKTTKRRRVSK